MASDEVTTSLKQYIMTEVRQRIIDGRYELGQRLSENTLARELETSRAPVRDALMTLRAEKLVQVYPQRGSYVFNPGVEERRALCEMCAVYESGGLVLAMENNYERLCEDLGTRLAQDEKTLKSADLYAWAAADRDFHEAIVGLSGNPLLINAYQVVGARLAALVHRLPSSHDAMNRCVALHRDILTLVRDGERSRAVDFIRADNLAVADLLCA